MNVNHFDTNLQISEESVRIAISLILGSNSMSINHIYLSVTVFRLRSFKANIPNNAQKNAQQRHLFYEALATLNWFRSLNMRPRFTLRYCDCGWLKFNEHEQILHRQECFLYMYTNWFNRVRMQKGRSSIERIGLPITRNRKA